MADMLANAMAWLDDKRHDHMSREVVYTRGSRTAIVRATKGRSFAEAESMADIGVVQRMESTDWLIRKDDLNFGDGLPPQRGDRVTDDDGYVYEVMPFGLIGDSHWQWASEPIRTTYRIHSKLIEK